jgi:hypothetical protein
MSYEGPIFFQKITIETIWRGDLLFGRLAITLSISSLVKGFSSPSKLYGTRMEERSKYGEKIQISPFSLCRTATIIQP